VDLKRVHAQLNCLLATHDTWIDAYYYCPHHPDARVRSFATACVCRKPSPGMLLRAAFDWCVDLRRSWMIGDLPSDVEAGRSAGCRAIRVGKWREDEPVGSAAGLREAADIIVGLSVASSTAGSVTRQAARRE
jgi:histidinol-phosphate phosphatase family protein